MRLALFALMAVAASFAAEIQEFYEPSNPDSLYFAWGVLAAGALTLSIFLAGIIYMAGNFLMNEKIKGWAKAEAVEILYSGVLLAVVGAFYLTANQVASSLVYSIDTYSADLVCSTSNPLFNTFTMHGEPVDLGYAHLPCHMRVAKNFLASIFYETGGFVKSVGVTHSWYTYLSSFSFDFTPVGTTTFFSGGSFNFAIFGFLNAKNNALSFLFDNGIKVLTLVRFQEVLINFVGTALFPVLLMAGLVLRTFMLTRRLGGLLMAMAISLYYVFPAFYVLGDSVYTSIILANYNNSVPLENRSALAQIFTDFNAMPKKINDSYQENMALATNGSNASSEFLSQIGLLTSTTLCNKTAEEVQNYTNQYGSVTGANLSVVLDSFGSENRLLGSWLTDSFSKGGTPWYLGGGVTDAVMNTASFRSILTGIDVLAKAVFFSMFFSFISIFATIASVKSLSPMLGGDVEIAGLTHLI